LISPGGCIEHLSNRADNRTASEYIFAGRDPANSISVSWLEKLHRRNCSNLGLPDDCVIHSQRHTFATRLGETGTADAFTVKDLLGHSSIVISQRYVHPGAKKRAVEALEHSTPETPEPQKSGFETVSS
jgi:integrase